MAAMPDYGSNGHTMAISLPYLPYLNISDSFLIRAGYDLFVDYLGGPAG